MTRNQKSCSGWAVVFARISHISARARRTAATRVGAAVLGAAAIAWGCTDAPTVTTPETQRPQLIHVPYADTFEVAVLKRTRQIEVASVRGVIRPGADGKLEIPSAGVKLSWGIGAVSEPVEVTMTALPGDAVAYDFQPHGLQFLSKVKIEQSLKNTNANGKESEVASLKGAYFPTVLLDDLTDGYAKAVEEFPTEPDSKLSKIKFEIDHFSGYMVSSGRRPVVE